MADMSSPIDFPKKAHKIAKLFNQDNMFPNQPTSREEQREAWQTGETPNHHDAGPAVSGHVKAFTERAQRASQSPTQVQNTNNSGTKPQYHSSNFDGGESDFDGGDSIY